MAEFVKEMLSCLRLYDSIYISCLKLPLDLPNWFDPTSGNLILPLIVFNPIRVSSEQKNLTFFPKPITVMAIQLSIARFSPKFF